MSETLKLDGFYLVQAANVDFDWIADEGSLFGQQPVLIDTI